MGCRTGQGFLLSRPVAAEVIDGLLASPASLLPFPAVEDGWMVDLAAR